MKNNERPEETQLIKKEPESPEIEEKAEELIKDAPPEVQEFIKKAPPEIRSEIRRFIAMASMTMPVPHPLFGKFTAAHIDKMLDYTAQDSERDFKFASLGRWFHLCYIIIGIIFLGFLIIYLTPSNKDILIEILKFIVFFAGGFGAGFGYRAIK